MKIIFKNRRDEIGMELLMLLRENVEEIIEEVECSRRRNIIILCEKNSRESF